MMKVTSTSSLGSNLNGTSRPPFQVSLWALDPNGETGLLSICRRSAGRSGSRWKPSTKRRNCSALVHLSCGLALGAKAESTICPALG